MSQLTLIEYGEWYICVTCRKCNCKLFLFHDLNRGDNNFVGVISIACPHCGFKQDLPFEHHQYGGQKNRCTDALIPHKKSTGSNFLRALAHSSRPAAVLAWAARVMIESELTKDSLVFD